ncbi:MAG TPA: phosphate ABC transporter substrate-binding protein PstS [Spongiibacteraceae bacterium]|nr:phosphate ABC transporter substrate-binding protein PstS [Spongiibacteraceae bacterium]
MRFPKLILSVALANLMLSPAFAADITGAGSTFAYPIFSKWADSYKTKTDIGLNYQAIGSGGGIKQITEKTVNFGASDMPLLKKDLDEKGLVQFPAIMGGVVPVVNLEGVKPGELKLTGSVLADIYLGKIKQWNDPAIAALNPGLKLSDDNITIVRRADGSGTTFIFTNYLSKISEEWKTKVGNSTAVAWPEGVAGKGNAGVASYVQRIEGAIGYVEYAYAKSANMTYTQLQNRDGAYVMPNNSTFQAAAAYADWTHAENFYEVLTNEPGKDSWPITGATFVLMQAGTDKAEDSKRVLEFFDWSFKNGADAAVKLDYVPMPENVVKLIENSWKASIKDSHGKAVWH